MKHATWQEFFKDCGGDSMPFKNYGGTDYIPAEDVYQHFKTRLAEELMVKSPELLELSELIDTRPVD